MARFIVRTPDRDADEVSRQIWLLAEPEFITENRGAEYAIERIVHPTTGEKALLVNDTWSFPVHPELRTNPGRIDADYIADLLIDPSAAVADAASRGRLPMQAMRGHVKTNLVLSEEDARDAGWFAEPEEER